MSGGRWSGDARGAAGPDAGIPARETSAGSDERFPADGPSPVAEPTAGDSGLSERTPSEGTPVGDPMDPAAGAGPASPGPEGAGILTDVAALTAERDEYLVALQRLQADFDNYRKRMQRQLQEQSARAEGALVNKLLPVLDVMDLAASHLSGGGDGGSAEAEALAQARASLVDALAKEGLERVDQAEVAFDPLVHDAVAHAPAERADGADEEPGGGGPKVEEVLRAGYRWQGQTLRPAMVKVRG